MIDGYARVSTADQDLDSLLGQLKAAGCERIFYEKITGTHANRPQLKKLLRQATRGDVLIVTRLDRLARSTRDLLNTLAAIADKGARFLPLATHGRTRPRRTGA